MKNKKALAIIPVVIGIVTLIFVFTSIIPKQKLAKAMNYLDTGNYKEGYAILEELNRNDLIESSKRERATACLNSGKYNEAYSLLEDIGDSETINASRYSRAISLLESGKDLEAYDLLKDLTSYKDSEKLKAEIKNNNPELQLKEAQVGDIIKMGKYEQDGDEGNGNEDIEWVVLDKSNGSLLLLSKYILDHAPYNNQRQSVYWSTCTIREWLNNDFIQNAFSEDERKIIKETEITTKGIEGYSVGGPETKDRVFLLSAEEAKLYMKTNTSRKAMTTVYEGYAGSAQSDNWILRSPGGQQDYVQNVRGQALNEEDNGSINNSGNIVSVDEGIRPAMWIAIG